MNTNEIFLGELFLGSERTGGPLIYRQNHDEYVAIEDGRKRIFHIAYLAKALGDRWHAGITPQEHASLILLACCGKRLFEWLDTERN